jgi:hypothetical protein
MSASVAASSDNILEDLIAVMRLRARKEPLVAG